jgi:hypothetical protein
VTDSRDELRYAIADRFLVRMAGVPFDVVAPLATPRALALARELGEAERALDERAAAAAAALRRDGSEAGARRREGLLEAIGRRLAVRRAPEDAAAEVGAYAAALERVRALEGRQAEVLREELEAGWRAVRAAAARFLPEYALFASESVEDLAADLRPDGTWAPERLKDGRRDRTLLMYVQRLATKNETVSTFGPSAWGTVDPAARGLRLEPAGLRRHAFLEKWVADALVGAMNRDGSVRAELAPRLHPAGRLEEGGFVRLDTGVRVALDAATLPVALRCDGRTPAHALGDPGALAALAAAGVILWEAECPRFRLDRVEALLAAVRGWRAGEARSRWEPILGELAEVPRAFERDPDPAPRRALARRVRETLAGLGAAPQGAPQRTLYRAANPVGEECVREGAFVLGADAAREVIADVQPWLDLWRDVFAFAAHRVNAKLAALHAAAAPRAGAVPLPAFLRAADAAGLPLALTGVPGLAFLAFLEARAAFSQAVAARPDAPEWTLSAEDCAFLRRRFEFPRFDAFTYPSADLQLAARSAADVAAGRHRWIVAELHFPGVALQHGVYWGCPDPDGFGRHVRAMAGGPFADWGFLPADLTNKTLLHFEGVRDLWTYAGPGAIAPGWRSVRPADVEVVVAEEGDVRMRAGGRDLGSFARSWVLALGFHPFQLARADHTPRLVLGRTVVQRETWTVRREELAAAGAELSTLAVARVVDRLRARRGIPRHVYVRPTDDAVRRLGAGGRDKDVKPFYVDLESWPFLQLLARAIAKHGEVEVTEMLPGPDELLWREPEGRRTFELRVLVVPRGDR